MTELTTLIRMNDEDYCTDVVLVLLYDCHLPTLILIIFGVVSRSAFLQQIDLFTVKRLIYQNIRDEGVHNNVVSEARCSPRADHSQHLTAESHVLASCDRISKSMKYSFYFGEVIEIKNRGWEHQSICADCGKSHIHFVLGWEPWDMYCSAQLVITLLTVKSRRAFLHRHELNNCRTWSHSAAFRGLFCQSWMTWRKQMECSTILWQYGDLCKDLCSESDDRLLMTK